MKARRRSRSAAPRPAAPPAPAAPPRRPAPASHAPRPPAAVAPVVRTRHRRQLRPLALEKPSSAPERAESQDVGEQDRRVEAEPSIGCSVTSQTSAGVWHRSRNSDALARSAAVRRQITTRLAHHPDRRHRKAPRRASARISGLRPSVHRPASPGLAAARAAATLQIAPGKGTPPPMPGRPYRPQTDRSASAPAAARWRWPRRTRPATG